MSQTQQFDMTCKAAWEPGGLTEAGRRKLQLVLLDTVGVMLAGSGAAEVQALAQSVGARSGPCAMVGQRLRASMPGAALVNGVAAAWLDFDPPHAHPRGAPLRPSAHYACHIVPAALAAAEVADATGAEFVDAVLAGYEWAARIGDRWHQRPGIHPHGTVPMVGAAIATETLLRSTTRSLDDVGQSAAMLTLMPPYTAALDGATVRNGFAGVGASLGTLAAVLPSGFTGVAAPLERVFGEVSGIHLAEEPDSQTQMEVERACFKLYPCARYLHASIEAARATCAGGVAAENVRCVIVDTYALAADLDNGIPCPRTPLEARFSIPFSVAVALTRGHVLPEDFVEPRLSDPVVRAVARRTRIRSSNEMTAEAPERLRAQVTVNQREGDEIMGDGTAVGPDAPLDTLESQLREKFTRLVQPVLGPAGAAQAMQDLMGMTRVDSVRAWLGRMTQW